MLGCEFTRAWIGGCMGWLALGLVNYGRYGLNIWSGAWLGVNGWTILLPTRGALSG